ncbi:MAG TPA: hydantoinase/oxoprolinase family protein [Gammaproteobacteria bacterium]|nr:hydantoinase/oxoprolinase family protein [Gammaproteobacteria bacterium]
MGFEVNIDIGGTFTDFFATRERTEVRVTKTPTTHYDLSVGFMKGMADLARAYGVPAREFLERTQAVHYCTTVGTNALIERNGPKLGLITTAGFEDQIFLGRARSWADGGSSAANKDLARIARPSPLISRDMVVGIHERIDSFGKVLCPVRREEVLDKLQLLVDRGAMGFVVCLLWSFANPAHERQVKDIIEDEYPEDYLGSMPVTLASDVSPRAGEYTRFMTAIVNAYIHGVMADQLGKLVNELRDGGYSRPLLLVHNTGGMKKVSRTRSVLTHNAGPVAGLHGALTLGQAYGYPNAIFTDMGGTSFDIGVVTGGELKTYDFIPVIDRWRTNIPAVEVKSIGAGGGSIAWLNASMGRALEIGPQSAGSMPGPACYDQGGREPTVMDADLVLGYLNPDHYLGGRMLLDPELSREVIEQKIARPLGLSVVEAAMRIRRLVDARMGQEVFNEVAVKGHDPREFVLFACGGAGPTHCCGFAPYVGAQRVIASPFSPVFGAFGASTVPIRQVWEKSRAMKIFQWTSQSYAEDYAAFNEVVAELKDLALRDLRLEGFHEAEVRFRLELEMRYGMQFNLTKVVSPLLAVASAADYRLICERFTAQYSEIYTPEAAFPQGGINVECFYLTAAVARRPLEFATRERAGAVPPAAARRPPRRAHWATLGAACETPVYAFEALDPGNTLDGPALVEARDTTFVVEPGWRFTLDSYGNGVLEQTAAPSLR